MLCVKAPLFYCGIYCSLRGQKTEYVLFPHTIKKTRGWRVIGGQQHRPSEKAKLNATLLQEIFVAQFTPAPLNIDILPLSSILIHFSLSCYIPMPNITRMSQSLPRSLLITFLIAWLIDFCRSIFSRMCPPLILLSGEKLARRLYFWNAVVYI